MENEIKKEESKIDKALNNADKGNRFYIIILIIFKIITKPNEWEFHHGGFGFPHLHDHHCVMIRYPLVPIFFTISFYGQKRVIYPILFYPMILFVFIYITVYNLIKKAC